MQPTPTEERNIDFSNEMSQGTSTILQGKPHDRGPAQNELHVLSWYFFILLIFCLCILIFIFVWSFTLVLVLRERKSMKLDRYGGGEVRL